MLKPLIYINETQRYTQMSSMVQIISQEVWKFMSGRVWHFEKEPCVLFPYHLKKNNVHYLLNTKKLTDTMRF